MTAATDPTADVDRAQHALDALVDEQRRLPDLISHASRGDDADQWARLALRSANVGHEIAQATADLLRARLELAWREAEDAMPPAAEARAALVDAHRAMDDYEQQHRAPETTMSEVAARQLERAHLCDQLTAANLLAHDATHRAEAALLAVDELEDQLEVATGQRPTAGPGIRATPAPLPATYVLTPPSGNLAHTHPYETGSIPPRWVAYRIAAGRTP